MKIMPTVLSPLVSTSLSTFSHMLSQLMFVIILQKRNNSQFTKI